MTAVQTDLNRLTPAEAERYWSGEWVAAHGPRCSLCGCLIENDGEDGYEVCSCKGAA